MATGAQVYLYIIVLDYSGDIKEMSSQLLLYDMTSTLYSGCGLYDEELLTANEQLICYPERLNICGEVLEQEFTSLKIREILQISRNHATKQNYTLKISTYLDDIYQLFKSFLSDVSQFSESAFLMFCYVTNLSLSILQCLQLPSISELCYFNTLKQTQEKYDDTSYTLLHEAVGMENYEFYSMEKFSITCYCMEEHFKHEIDTCIESVVRSQDNKQVKKELNKNLQEGIGSFTDDNLGGSGSQSAVPPQSSATNKHLPPTLEAATPGQGATLNNESLAGQDQAGGITEATGYTTGTLPGATVSFSQYYGTDFDKDQPLSREERRKDVRVVPKEKDVDSILESRHKDEASSRRKLPSELQATAKPSTKPRTSANVDRPPRLPRRACLVHNNERYSLDPKLLLLPSATKYLVKKRTEISPGRFMAKLELHCAR